MRKKDLGMFLGGGGNKVFFNLGFIQELRRQGVSPSLLVGVSASSSIMFEEILGCEGFSLKSFGKRLRENKKNFYLFSKNHFPHNDIYKNSIDELFRQHKKFSEINIHWKILASQSSKRFYRTKCFLSSLILLLERSFMKNFLLKIFGVKERIFDSKENFSKKDLINIIMGSSTIYPFIQPHFYEDNLILEGGLINVNYNSLFQKNKKILVIIPEKGETKIIRGRLHIFSSINVLSNVLDYTNEKKIFDLYNQGRNEAKMQLGIIKNYLN